MVSYARKQSAAPNQPYVHKEHLFSQETEPRMPNLCRLCVLHIEPFVLLVDVQHTSVRADSLS